MTWFSEALFHAFLVSLAIDLIASSVYLGLSHKRSSAAAGAIYSVRGDVKFESVWGMILSVPALLLVLAGSFAPGAERWFVLLVFGVLLLYGLFAFALAGRRIPRVVRAYPALIACGVLPLLWLTGIVQGYGVLWFMVFPLMSSRLVVGYVADCKVGLRFLRAMQDFDKHQHPTRSFSRYPSRLRATPLASELAS